VPKRRTDTASKRLRKTAKDVTATPAAPRLNGTPPKPASLAGRAAEIWDEFAPELVAIGMLTSRDVLMFALWCQLGAKIETGELSSALVTQFRLLGNDFGCSPSGKGRECAPAVPSAKPHKFFKD
jgi:phage terminase small subunit